MPKFRITESAPSIVTWVHYVNAETEQEALEKMLDGKAEETYMDFSDADNVIIESIEEIKED